ncbi:uncharacterized protein LOC143027695 isoform X1 [Oratosquilla oratoria]|uniref:uncharacterized protein LOC143027695 isoform X1 n=1 Tax=Oratosquilla oratoria TaxID=337810 RepID=UPI003F75A197
MVKRLDQNQSKTGPYTLQPSPPSENQPPVNRTIEEPLCNIPNTLLQQQCDSLSLFAEFAPTHLPSTSDGISAQQHLQPSGFQNINQAQYPYTKTTLQSHHLETKNQMHQQYDLTNDQKHINSQTHIQQQEQLMNEDLTSVIQDLDPSEIGKIDGYINFLQVASTSQGDTVFEDTPGLAIPPIREIPDTTGFKGDFEFKVSFPENSSKLIVQEGENGIRKLYTTDGEAVTTCIKHAAGRATTLRIFICYKDATLMAKPVHPCKVNRKDAHPYHMMDIVCSNEVRWFDQPHPSIVIPIGLQPSNSQGDYKLQLKFLCRNSCIKRKGLYLIFQLEERNHTIGRETLELKVSACPKRDSRGKRAFGEAFGDGREVLVKIGKASEPLDTLEPSQPSWGSQTSQPMINISTDIACDFQFQDLITGLETGAHQDSFTDSIPKDSFERSVIPTNSEHNPEQLNHQEVLPKKASGGGTRVIVPKELPQDDHENELFQMLGDEGKKKALNYMKDLFLGKRFRELHPDECFNEEIKFMTRFKTWEGN